jgi:hypothetical protein
MKNKSIESFLTIFFVIAISASFSFAQNMDSMKMGNEHMKGMNKKNDSTQMMDHENMKNMNMQHNSTMNMDTTKSVKDSIIREGVIDLKAIDKNKDGKVYQCTMDFNSISDKPGIDPACGMKLKEVSLKKAKENLLKKGFKVKE